MTRAVWAMLLVMSLTGGCAFKGAPASAPPPPRAASAPPPAAPSAPAAAAATSHEGLAASRPQRPPDMSADELALWNDPAFQRQFAESYIAETDIEPKVTAPEREVMLKVLALIAADSKAEAMALLEKSRTDASSAVLDFTLANLYFEQERLDDAAAAYSAATKKTPRFRRAWRQLGLTFIRGKEYAKALAPLTRAIELGAADSNTYGLLGFAYMSVDDFLASESAYRLAILLDPRSRDWKLGLAQSLFRQERYEDAAALCGKLIKESPDEARFWTLQAGAFLGMNKPMRAAENYEVVDRMGKATARDLTMLGNIYINEELNELAADAYMRAMAMSTTAGPDAVVRAAKVLAARGAAEQARTLMDRIETAYAGQLPLQTQQDLKKIRYRIAVARGDAEDAAGVLTEIVEQNPLDGEALIWLGQHYEKIDKAEQAVFYYQRAAGLEKFEADAKVRHAQLLVKQRKYAEALPLLRSSQQLKPRESVQKFLEDVERFAKSKG